MTDAYIQGFCKTAEAHGVDPQELCKYANIIIPATAGVLGGLISQEKGGDRLRNAGIGAGAGAASLGGLSTLKAISELKQLESIIGKLPASTKAGILLKVLGATGLTGGAIGGLGGAFFGKKKKKGLFS